MSKDKKSDDLKRAQERLESTRRKYKKYIKVIREKRQFKRVSTIKNVEDTVEPPPPKK